MRRRSIKQRSNTKKGRKRTKEKAVQGRVCHLCGMLSGNSWKVQDSRQSNEPGFWWGSPSLHPSTPCLASCRNALFDRVVFLPQVIRTKFQATGTRYLITFCAKLAASDFDAIRSSTVFAKRIGSPRREF